LVKKRRFDRRNVIDRINDWFSDVKTIMFIRTQKTWILRHYWQYLRSGGLLGLHDFVESFFNNENLDAHYINMYRRWTGKLCDCIDNVFGFKRRLELEERHLRMIEQRYSSNNRKLSELLNVDLSSYAYP